jgi:3-hydroxybutyryl-CoA dehydrogenase
VIEAVSEDLALKRSVFAALEQAAPAHAILATNTSVIPVGAIVEGLGSAARMVGTHFWNPPALIPLVEVVQGPRTATDTVTATIELLRGAGKCPVHVRRDVPGFVGNRLQHALWREAIAIVAGGICDAETVDVVVTQGFGARLAAMGPIENADLVGLDLTLAIHERVLPDLDRTPGPSPLLRELVDEGRLGMKTGSGLREWSPGSAERSQARLIAHLREQLAAQGGTTTTQERQR